jgi:hypothetical protein
MGIDAVVAAAADIFGTGAAAAAPAVAAGATDAAATAGLTDIVGTGAGLFGGTTGLEGTALAAGAGSDLGALVGTGAATAAGTADAFLGAPAASGFGSGAAGAPSLLSGAGAGASGANSALSSIVGGSATPTTAGGASVFDTGTGGIPGVSSTGAPSATAAPSAIAPPGASAASLASPSGVATAPDATAAASGATPAAGTAGTSSSIQSLLGKAGNGLVSSLTSNPLGVALGAGGLGYSIYEGTQNTKNEQALTAAATTANANSGALEAQGQGLVNYLTSGTLPAGYQTQVTQAINAAITNAKSNAAAQGLSTDPTQNSALAAQIAEIQNQEPIMQEQIASQLAGTGTSLINAGATAAGLSGQLYQSLVQNDTTQAANAGKAIATLAAALNGKSTNTIGSTTISTS